MGPSGGLPFTTLNLDVYAFYARGKRHAAARLRVCLARETKRGALVVCLANLLHGRIEDRKIDALTYMAQ